MEFSSAEDAESSVHFCSYPELNPDHKNDRLEEAVAIMQRVVLLARKRREETRINLRVPLAKLVVIHSDQRLLNELRRLEDYIRVETQRQDYRIRFE